MEEKSDDKSTSGWLAFAREHLVKPLAVALATAVVGAAVAVITPIGSAVTRGWKAAIYGTTEADSSSADLTAFPLPDEVAYSKVWFQTPPACAGLISDWAEEAGIDVLFLKNTSRLLTQKSEGKPDIVQRADCISLPSNGSSLATFTPVQTQRDNTRPAAPTNIFTKRFSVWLAKKQSGAYFSEPQNWYQPSEQTYVFMLIVDVTDKDSQFDVKHDRLPRRVAVALINGDFNHSVCDNHICSFAAPGASINLLRLKGPVPNPVSAQLSFDIKTQVLFLGVSIVGSDFIPNAKFYGDAELDELFSSISGVTYISASTIGAAEH